MIYLIFDYNTVPIILSPKPAPIWVKISPCPRLLKWHNNFERLHLATLQCQIIRGDYSLTAKSTTPPQLLRTPTPIIRLPNFRESSARSDVACLWCIVVYFAILIVNRYNKPKKIKEQTDIQWWSANHLNIWYILMSRLFLVIRKLTTPPQLLRTPPIIE